MATFKPVVRTPRKDGFYKVYIRVVHKIKPGYISTDKLVTKKFIDIFCFTLKIHYLCSMDKKDMIGSVDAMLDEKYGKVGTPEREQFRKEARAYCECEYDTDTTEQ